MMNFKIGQVNVVITIIDWENKRIVIDLSAPLAGMTASVVVQTNKDEDRLVSVGIEMSKGMPF